MIRDPFKLLHDDIRKRQDAALSSPEYLSELSGLADLAARMARPRFRDGESHHPGDRLPSPDHDIELPDSVVVNATNAIVGEVDCYGEGDHEHLSPCSNYTVPVKTCEPELYVLDKDGNPVDGFRLMVRFRVDD